MKSSDPYKAPESDLGEENFTTHTYAGFWLRVVATIIDSILTLLVTMPILTAYYGTSYFSSNKFTQGPVDVFMSYVFPAVAVILFWIYRSATPGKMMLGMKIVDYESRDKASAGQLLLRYLCYYLCMLPLFLGFAWVGFQKEKRGWHDLICGTAVIKE